MKAMTITQVKEAFRDNQSIMIDEIKDPYVLRAYFYRLAKMNIIYETCNSNHYAVYAVTPPQETN